MRIKKNFALSQSSYPSDFAPFRAFSFQLAEILTAENGNEKGGKTGKKNLKEKSFFS